MLDLMNHQAGFDDTPLYLKGDKSNLKELLSDYQPIQSFEPGTTTIYSNYGTSLAAYIVERISGQTYVDYVHEHIFRPLDMDRTAILPNLSDNAYVQKKRKEDKGYTSEGELIGDAPYEVGLYPAGRATGTLDDLQKFAQALLSHRTLFNRPETWTTLYTTSLTYPGTDTVRNAHGFWANEYGVTVLGHGGNTNGFSSYLRLDLKKGVGQVIMTNQFNEQIYNYQMPELIFGKLQTASAETKKEFEPGYYRVLRNYNQGPATWTQLLPNVTFELKDSSSEQLDGTFWTLYKYKGKTRIATSVSDLEKVPDWEIWTQYGLAALAGLSVLYALGSLLVRLLLGLYRLILGKKKSSQARALKIWQILTAAGITAFAGNFLLLLQSAMDASDYSVVSQWRYMVFAGLGLLLAGCAIYPFLTKAKSQLSRSGKVLTVLTSLSALAIVVNILYWSLYQWWVV
ncbi:Beta-lactamase [Streptococcus sp. DD11]|nr:Beta-lactamase [Streptococcus sp. DD11]